MSRLDIKTASKAQTVVDRLYKDMERRIASSPPGLCPIDMSLTFLQLCHAQSCGKCVPCRIGLGQLAALMGQVLDGTGTMLTIDTIEKTARAIVASADCAIGRDAAQLVLSGFEGFRDDYVNHVQHHRCLASLQNPVPCVSLCPAGVDVPGYVALVREGRYADAVRLIRKDNPMPTACAYICEHPCEARCRRNMVDAPINIRGLKRYAVDHAGNVPNPACGEATGKRVAIIGGGPSGLSCAYYLRLMGHSVTIFEEKKRLGGMLRYGIPAYRFPREKLDAEIASILSTGVEVHTGVTVGKDISFEQLHKDYDCLYVAIGAQKGKGLRIDGAKAEGVISAVDLLGRIGDGDYPDFSGKRVAVIGGGNVAMDCVRTAVRAGADEVSCVYRRRVADMTALDAEIESAIAEGVEMITLESPDSIETNEAGQVVALITQPQMISAVKGGRPSVKAADKPKRRIEADVILVAVGQGIESQPFEDAGMLAEWGEFKANEFLEAQGENGTLAGVFVGGDCQTGPATAIKAIGAGKVAARNIDEYLGYHHTLDCGVDVPAPSPNDRAPKGRVEISERPARERKRDFAYVEMPMSREEAVQECGRCLRCDHFGCGAVEGGRIQYV